MTTEHEPTLRTDILNLLLKIESATEESNRAFRELFGSDSASVPAEVGIGIIQSKAAIDGLVALASVCDKLLLRVEALETQR